VETPEATAVPESGSQARERRLDPRGYWRANLRLMAWLLAVWFAASFGLGILLVEPLNAFSLGGFPLGFWFAHQGSILVFVVLVAIYAVAMDRLDRRYGVD
jgi:putative solute:sodium symporter small subunit